MSGNLKSDNPSSTVSYSDYSLVVCPPDLGDLRKAAPWMKDPKWFRAVSISPSAVMKIMSHCESGVIKGIRKGGNPVEVMGMLLGRPDANHTLVVTDAFPLPIEGFETRVIADDVNVVNHMIQLGESLEKTRKEKFMDLSTQLQWQRAEDPHGNPFVAIVVDPLRSTYQQEPELKAFRVYPPEFSGPSNECPNGVVEMSEQVRLEHWGSCWSRYYELAVEYRMTPACRQVLEQLTQDYLWIRNLQAKPMEASKLTAVAKQCRVAASQTISTSSLMGTPASSGAGAGPGTPSLAAVTRGAGGARSSSGGGGSSATAAAYSRGRAEQGMAAPTVSSSEWSKAVEKLVDLADEQVCEKHLQSTKERVFG